MFEHTRNLSRKMQQAYFEAFKLLTLLLLQLQVSALAAKSDAVHYFKHRRLAACSPVADLNIQGHAGVDGSIQETLKSRLKKQPIRFSNPLVFYEINLNALIRLLHTLHQTPYSSKHYELFLIDLDIVELLFL